MTKGPPTQNMPKGPVFLRYATAHSLRKDILQKHAVS